jgi:alpha-maltose-1-phosphate synthase
MLPREKTIHLYSHAAIFVCPSVYEPFGIINLEAMACETPVVASAVGGIPEVVEHGETGLLVAPEAISATDVEPRHPEQFARDLAMAVNTLLVDPDLRASMARRARARVEERFSWSGIARETLDFYHAVIERHAAERSIPTVMPPATFGV